MQARVIELLSLVTFLWLEWQAVQGLTCYRCYIHKCISPDCMFTHFGAENKIPACPQNGTDWNNSSYHSECGVETGGSCGHYYLHISSSGLISTPTGPAFNIKYEDVHLFGCTTQGGSGDTDTDIRSCPVYSAGQLHEQLHLVNTTATKTKTKCYQCNHKDFCNTEVFDEATERPDKPPFKPPKPPNIPKPPPFKPPSSHPYPHPVPHPHPHPHPMPPPYPHPHPHPAPNPKPPKPPKPDSEEDKPIPQVELPVPGQDQENSGSGSTDIAPALQIITGIFYIVPMFGWVN